MNIARRNIEIAFILTPPEDVVAGLKERERFFSKRPFAINAFGMSRDYYIMTSRKLGSAFSQDEIGNMYEVMRDTCCKYERLPQSLFQLLAAYDNDVLKVDGSRPVCRREKLMNFRAISLKLGQDIFTTSFLAFRNIDSGSQKQHDFSWNTVIDTDDRRLKHVLSQGIAENHFHLTGSTPLFSLSWIALMNHPLRIQQFFSDFYGGDNPFKENRSKNVSFNNKICSMTWEQILKNAAWIRAHLFMAVNGNPQNNLIVSFLQQTDELFGIHKLNRIILGLRMTYGAKFIQPDLNKRCLDYAIRKNNLLTYADADSHLLFGERELLYRCFLACFRNEFSQSMQNLFYLYLLLKARFRSELVQINSEVGFANFSAYQDRKSAFWEEMPEYLAEAHRMAVNLTFNNSAVRSMEIRLVPKGSRMKNIRKIMEIDNHVIFAEKSKHHSGALGTQLPLPDKSKFPPLRTTSMFWLTEREKAEICGSFPFFFVFHFIKSQLRPIDRKPIFYGLDPRNHSVRQTSMKCALALADALQANEYLCARIRGIDAASFEIGCRPETFAVEFRFLKSFIPTEPYVNLLTLRNRVQPKLGISYHVGEDFLDIADGLRAIDEAMRFLHMSRGDRLGHALALGVDPHIHYKLKRHYVLLSKQDMLDNTVWLLYRSLELGVTIPTNLRRELEARAEQLLSDIYGKCIAEHHWTVSTDDYYHSWKLRGDHPDCYSSVCFCNPYLDNRFYASISVVEKYRSHYVNTAESNAYRRKENIAGILHYYHYGYHERVEGAKTIDFSVTEDYIALMNDMQEQFRRIISEAGIAVECNLSSNFLIGTFGRYENHPIFRFNKHGLVSECNRNDISVSLNTDDQGVFDTSLENEYAILVDCMSKMKGIDHLRLYSDDTIYEYADYIRSLGCTQIFPESL